MKGVMVGGTGMAYALENRIDGVFGRRGFDSSEGAEYERLWYPGRARWLFGDLL